MTARLVELDPRNTEVAARLVARAGLAGIEIVTPGAIGVVPGSPSSQASPLPSSTVSTST